MLEKLYHITLGTLFMAFGVYIICYTFDIIKYSIFFSGWWTLLVIIPAAYRLFFQNDKVNSLFWIASGVTLLLQRNNIISFNITWKLIVSFIVLVLGFNLVCYGFRGPRAIKARKRKVPLYFGMFGEAEEKVNTEFSGSKCTAVLGGVDLDLTEAKLDKEVHIEVMALLGTIEIMVPIDANVVTSGVNILGNSENKMKKATTRGRKKATTIYINSTSILGSVEIR